MAKSTLGVTQYGVLVTHNDVQGTLVIAGPNSSLTIRCGLIGPPYHSRMLEDPIYMWGCKYLYQDKCSNLVTGQYMASHVTNQRTSLHKRPLFKTHRF